MKSKLIFKILTEVLFNVWLLCYGLVVLCFIIALISKIANAEVKNLSWNNFAILGLVLIGLMIINIIALKQRAKKQKLQD